MEHITKPKTDGSYAHKNTRKSKYMAHVMGLTEIHSLSRSHTHTHTQAGWPICRVIYFKLWETSECNNSRQRWLFLQDWSEAVNLSVRGRCRNQSISLTKYWNGRSSHHGESIINQRAVMTTLQNVHVFDWGTTGVRLGLRPQGTEIGVLWLLVHVYCFEVISKVVRS